MIDQLRIQTRARKAPQNLNQNLSLPSLKVDAICILPAGTKPTYLKAKDCPGLTNTARFSGYLGPASQGDAQPGVAPLEPREDPPEDDQPGDQGNLLRVVLSTGRVQLDLLSRSGRRT